MTEADIGKLPISDIADKDCALFMWIIDSHLHHAMKIIEQWGFTYKTVAFVWAKTTKHNKWHFGQGYWTRKNPEICLMATRGSPKKASWAVRQLVVAPVREHSRKPDEVREGIVQLMGDVPRIELFARTTTPGWDVYGNETDKFKP
jgi:N6-adenosine-specific RNA methylase IME4